MTEPEVRLRAELRTRRDALAHRAVTEPSERLLELLQRIDEELGPGEEPAGICLVCSAEALALGGDSALRICLECLTPHALRELQRDLEKAAVVQRALLPPPTWARSGWEVAWIWEPLGVVSGDHVDLLATRDESGPVHVMLGDVVGKGIAAALLQSHLYALLRSLAAPELALGEILTRANRHLCAATLSAHYATLVGLRLHADGAVDLANAGHPRPLHVDRRGVRPVEGSGLPLGLFCESGYAERRLRLAPGDALLLYSDGWTEAASGADEEYGIGRAASALRRAARRPLPDLLEACRQDMEQFLGGTPRTDDLTMLVVRRIADQEVGRPV